MTTRSETFNGLREFQMAGRYFELLSTVNPVDIKFYDKDDRVLVDERQVVAGQWIDRRGADAFVRFEITTGANELVKFVATDGMSGSRVAPANVISSVFPLGLAHVQAKVTVTNASTTIVAANASRRYLFIQNQSETGTIYLTSDGDTAVADATGVRLAPGDSWAPVVPPLGAINAIGDIASNTAVQTIEA